MIHNIVFIGASWGALPAAHTLLKTVLPKIESSATSDKTTTYKVTIISSSREFYWKVGSPRTIVDPAALPIEKSLLPIEPAFKQYGDRFEFVHASAKNIDQGSQLVVLDNGASVHYDSLIIASGTSFISPIWSVAGPGGSQSTLEALKDIHARLPSAQTILVAGGGAAGVETAGELGYKYGKTKNITILSGSTQLLPRLDNKNPGIAAEKRLNTMGVKVRNGGLQVRKTTRQGDKEVVELSDGSSMTVDIFIEATGDRPNSSFVPKEWLDARGYVKTDARTLKLDVPGVENVYSIGSVASYSGGGIPDIQFAQAAFVESIRLGLLQQAGTPSTTERKIYYKRFTSQLQLVPIGPKGGVGVLFGWSVPSWMVWLIKARDYMIANAEKTVNGH